MRYTTELTQPVEFYIRGEEYSAQLEAFRDRIAGKSNADVNSFADAADTDATIHMIKAAAQGLAHRVPGGSPPMTKAAAFFRGCLAGREQRPPSPRCRRSAPWRKCRILNAWVDDLTVEQIVDRLDEGILWTLNPDHLYHLQRNAAFVDAYRQAAIVSSDSKYVYWGLKFLGRRDPVEGVGLGHRPGLLAAARA